MSDQSPQETKPESSTSEPSKSEGSSSLGGFTDPADWAKAVDQVVQTTERVTKEVYGYFQKAGDLVIPAEPLLELTEEALKKSAPEGSKIALKLYDTVELSFVVWRHSGRGRPTSGSTDLDDKLAGYRVKIPLSIKANVSRLSMKDKEGKIVKLHHGGSEVDEKDVISKIWIEKSGSLTLAKAYVTKSVEKVELKATLTQQAEKGSQYYLLKLSFNTTDGLRTLKPWTMDFYIDKAPSKFGEITMDAKKYVTLAK